MDYYYLSNSVFAALPDDFDPESNPEATIREINQRDGVSPDYFGYWHTSVGAFCASDTPHNPRDPRTSHIRIFRADDRVPTYQIIRYGSDGHEYGDMVNMPAPEIAELCSQAISSSSLTLPERVERAASFRLPDLSDGRHSHLVVFSGPLSFVDEWRQEIGHA